MHLLPNSNNIKIIKDKSDWNSKNRITTNDILKIILEFHQESNDGNIYHRKISTFANEIKFIQEFGIRTLNEYIDSERIGRSAERIQKKDRFAFWKVYSEYCDMIHHAGFTVDWNGFALYAYDQLLTCPKYDYIIIDEGQDFSVMMIKTLRKLLVNPDKGILFLGDTAQQIYGTKISWAKMGLKSIGSVKRLTKNYRNTNEIIKFAVDITTTKYWNRELSDSVLPEQCGRLGKKPLLIPCNNDKEVLREYLDKHKDTTTCIVVSTNEMAIDIRNVFNAQYITREMSNTLNPNHPVSVATFHAVKGFEFDNIFIYFKVR